MTLCLAAVKGKGCCVQLLTGIYPGWPWGGQQPRGEQRQPCCITPWRVCSEQQQVARGSPRVCTPGPHPSQGQRGPEGLFQPAGPGTAVTQHVVTPPPAIPSVSGRKLRTPSDTSEHTTPPPAGQTCCGRMATAGLTLGLGSLFTERLHIRHLLRSSQDDPEVVLAVSLSPRGRRIRN